VEIWKNIDGLEGRYQVSNLGNVRGMKGPIKAQPQNSGYLIVHLYLRGIRKVQLVHRLVALAFCEGDGDQVNHKSGDKANNAAANLEWCSRHENMRHAVALGLTRSRRFAVVGTPVSGGPTLVYPSQSAAERALCGRASSAVHHCIIGKKKSAYGYVWSRA
jgi:hypothetical protein